MTEKSILKILGISFKNTSENPGIFLNISLAEIYEIYHLPGSNILRNFLKIL